MSESSRSQSRMSATSRTELLRDAVMFASELFSLLPYRRVHSLSREIWHQPDVSDITGRCALDFLRDRGLIEQHPENLTWWRFIDPEKRAKPPSFDAIERVSVARSESTRASGDPLAELLAKLESEMADVYNEQSPRDLRKAAGKRADQITSEILRRFGEPAERPVST